jgi:hypothetical protein
LRRGEEARALRRRFERRGRKLFWVLLPSLVSLATAAHALVRLACSIDSFFKQNWCKRRRNCRGDGKLSFGVRPFVVISVVGREAGGS